MVAGVIAGAGNNGTGVSGVNWTGSIMGLGFMNSSGSGSTATAIRAIEFAIQAKRALGADANIRILNNSWGGSGFSQALLDQILKAQAAGMLFVAAAGNMPDDLDVKPGYPAAYTTAPNLLTVAATDNRDGIASFSAFGLKSVHAGAPGVSILTTSPNGQYSTVSGTSFSAPIASGIAGLVLAACGQLDTAALRKVILDNLDPVASLTGKTITGGRVNAYKAVRACGAPTFKLTATPGAISLVPGGSASVAVQVTGENGFSSAVTLSTTGLPPGVTGVFTPATAMPGTAVTLRLTAATTAAITSADVAASIRGVNNSLSITVPFTLGVRAPFTLSATPKAVVLNPGTSATVAVQITAASGFTSPVALTATGLPTGVTALFTPASAAPGTPVSLRLTAAANAANTALTAAFSVRGAVGAMSADSSIPIVVKAPFELAANPGAVQLTAGNSSNVAVQISSATGYKSALTLSVEGLPTGVTGVFTPASAAPGTPVTLRLTVAANTPVSTGPITLSVRGVNGTLSATAALALTITGNATFNVTATPAAVTINKGATGFLVLNIEAVGGFNQRIEFSVAGLPEQTSMTPSFPGPNRLALTLAISPNAVARSYPVIVTATSGTIRKLVNLMVIVR